MHPDHSASKSIIWTLCLIYVFATGVAHGAAANCRYDITAVIDHGKGTAKVKTKLIYRNGGSGTLRELVFHFTPNQKQKECCLVHVDESASVADESGPPLQVSPFVRDGKAVEDYFVVRLGKPLEPGDSVELQMQSEAAILTRCGARIKNLRGCWNPRVAYRDDRGWRLGVEQFADYRVTVGPLPQPLIPISGPVTNQEQDKDGNWMITSRASNIPDFSMVLSHAEHVITAVQGDVTINCFYTQNKERAEQRLSIAEDVVRFYRDLYGFYPGTWLNIVAYDAGGGGGGPVGSNIVYVLKDKLSWGVAHEIGHEYWGWSWVTGVPDTDPTRTWLCVGMGLWSDRQYMQARNMPCTVYSIMLNEYLDAARAGLNTKLENITERDLEHRMHDEKDLLHDKGYAIALMLEDLLGKDVLREIAKRTLDQFAHQAIDAEDFQRVCEDVSGQKLGWFFHQWVYTSDSLDYAVVDAKTTQVDSKQQIAVSIEAKGSARMPVDVLLELTDGSDVRKRVARNERRCTFTSDKPWRRVVIDPDEYLPDTNRFDNIMVALDGQMSEAETQAVDEFYKIRRKILSGENYEDTSTPLRTCLTVLSYLHARDANGFKRIKALSHDDENLDPKLTDEQMAGFQLSYAELDILRAPLPPGQPQRDTYWPIYMRKGDKAELANTFVFGFRDGKWKWFGNFAPRTDWRNSIKGKLSEWEEKEKYKGDPLLTARMSEAEV